jgi:alpha-beta hydrolase superfamily lysophospholipase/SAM-dependent methyltransferase
MHCPATALPAILAQPAERTFVTSDHAELFYRHWEPTTPQSRALLLFHRGHEHSGRFAELVESLGLEGVHVFAWDARGHGRSPGERGYAESVGRMVRDVEEFVRHVSTHHDLPVEQMVVLGHSVAAVTVATWVHDYAPPIRAMVLATPAFRVRLYVPMAIPGLRTIQAIRGKTFIKSYVRSKLLTHDPQQAAAYDADPLISRSIATNVLLDLHDTSTRIMEDAGAITTPALLLTAGRDWVVNNAATDRFFQRLGSRQKQLHAYPGFGHAIFHETDRHLTIAAVRQFIDSAFRLPSEAVSLLDADRHGYTRSEYDRLCAPAPPLSLGRLAFAAQRAFLKTIPRLSQGVRLGWRTGFDSGQSLDHIYQNRATGLTPLGRMIDRIYLSAIGWRGIRIRKANLERLLGETIELLSRSNKPVRVVDIASGPGRYVLDVLAKFAPGEVSALLRDHSAEARAAGARMAQEKGLTNVTFEDGDAFDFDSLAHLSPRPDVAIVSGLFELFPDNDKVLTALRGLAESISNDGRLIYTNQPWHPQIEMIARVLINRDGKPWIMRRRTTAEMDQLVRAAGFEKTDMAIDRYGIFTVSVARKTHQ